MSGTSRTSLADEFMTVVGLSLCGISYAFAQSAGGITADSILPAAAGSLNECSHSGVKRGKRRKRERETPSFLLSFSCLVNADADRRKGSSRVGGKEEAFSRNMGKRISISTHSGLKVSRKYMKIGLLTYFEGL